MSQQKFTRPKYKGRVTVATNEGWLSLGTSRDGAELLESIPGLFSKLDQAGALLPQDLEFAGNNAVGVNVVTEQPCEVTQDAEPTTATEETQTTEAQATDTQPEPEKQPEPDTKPEAHTEPKLTPLIEITEFTTELLDKYDEDDLVNFCNEFALGEPTNRAEAVDILINM